MTAGFRGRRRALVGAMCLTILLGCLGLPARVHGAFGLTTDTGYYAVDTGAGLVFKVRRTDNGSSTQSPGDLMSLVYNGVEYQDHTGWVLQAQTNTPGGGLGTNWVPAPDSVSTNRFFLPVDAGAGSVFFRLLRP